MQHRIPVAQLGPQGKHMASAVEACVHCGFCLPTCPTYVAMGEEMDSPRGRIILMKEVLEGGVELEEAMPYIDHCLGCVACVTACPSGVQYGELLTPFRAYVDDKRKRGLTERIMGEPPHRDPTLPETVCRLRLRRALHPSIEAIPTQPTESPPRTPAQGPETVEAASRALSGKRQKTGPRGTALRLRSASPRPQHQLGYPARLERKRSRGHCSQRPVLLRGPRHARRKVRPCPRHRQGKSRGL